MPHVIVNPAEVRSALRAILRAVDRHLTHINGNRQWRQEVIARFRAGGEQSLANSTNSSPPSAAVVGVTQNLESVQTVSGTLQAQSQHLNSAASLGRRPSSLIGPIAPVGHPPTAAQALALAREWAELANNIARHKELLLSYNIGLDVDERTKRMVEATARRVGFALPSSRKE
ncbi:hypothetical protein Vretimale_4491 [Volvox reticuliferus]|uniref:Uncharacterized protein n=1 Tax=Volvox reticuliferus TaxID=1737510 RepID=A0A8J4C1N9_9CHLO|nr:hypothetical protein Vretifemale_3112 [Volvox reticuliferus]GIL99296.1 hypothetical protein Vretimale_4491 [Volvox reticuliferus]